MSLALKLFSKQHNISYITKIVTGGQFSKVPVVEQLYKKVQDLWFGVHIQGDISGLVRFSQA